MAKRVLAWILTVVMLFSGNIFVLAENTQRAGSGQADFVTRMEWIQAVNSIFELSVEEKNYPDNYYSDIDATSEAYYDVMLATEFGLLDVLAGEAFNGEGAVTREFAAHTLNTCLGYVPESENYSFNEAATVTYPMDIQAAIELDWFTLADGNFLPEAAITVEEKETMLTMAEEIYSAQNVEVEENTYTFASEVIILPEETVINTLEDGRLQIENCPQTITAGDVFGIVYKEMPFVWKATAVEVSDNVTTITVESVDVDTAFEEISLNQQVEADLTLLQPANENVTLTYVVGGTKAKAYEDGTVYASLDEVGNQDVNAVIATEEIEVASKGASFNIGAAKVTVTCKVTDADLKRSTVAGRNTIEILFTTDFSCTINGDALEASNSVPSLPLFDAPLAPGVTASIASDMVVEGEANLRLVENIKIGIHEQNGHVFVMKNFKKESFTISIDATIQAGIKFVLNLTVLNVSGDLTGKLGVRHTVGIKRYDDGNKPVTCQSHEGYLYANLGYSLVVNLGYKKKTLAEDTLHIYDKNNSPIRNCYHLEDDVQVTKCTRKSSNTGYGGGNYYSPVNSKYYFNGKASSVTNASGETYTIFTYDLDKENKATITGYAGTAENVFIPKKIDGYEVVAIGARAFYENINIKSVVIPNTVTAIKSKAFYKCVSLEQVTLPEKLSRLESYAFYRCGSLETVEIPKEITEVVNVYPDDGGPFTECMNLRTVTFAEGIKEIPRYLFYNCTGLEKVVIPETVERIDNLAFSGCVNLSEVQFEGALKEIGPRAFEDCEVLTSMQIPDTVELIENSAFKNCTALKDVKLPKNLKTFYSYAFYNCDSLEQIEIPAGITKLSVMSSEVGGPFTECDNLKKVTFAKGITRINENLFYNCNGIEELILPETITSIGDSAFRGCNQITKLVIPYGVTVIEDYVFYEMEELREVTLPRSLKEIKTKGFSYPEKVTIYGYADSYAKTYADTNSIAFVALDPKDCAHKKEVKVTPATVSAPGKSVEFCDRCGAVFKEEIIPQIVVPKAPKVPKITKITVKKKSMQVAWKKDANVDGYEVRYALKKNFKGAKIAKISKKSTTKKVIKKLKKNKQYYVSIRAYKQETIDGKAHVLYSAWSKAKRSKKIK